MTGTGFAVSYLPDRVRIVPPRLTITGTTIARFRVDLSSPRAATVAVNYATAEGTAKSPADYQTASGTVFFSPGSDLEVHRRLGPARRSR